MAILLYRLGRFSFRRAWYVIIAWALILGGILGTGLALGGSTAESFTIPGTESQQTLDKLGALFPAVAGASAQVVYVAPEGSSINDPEVKEAINDMADEIGEISQVEAVIPPYSEYASNAISKDEQLGYSLVQFDGPTTDVTEKSIEELKATAAAAEKAGLHVEFGGDIFQEVEFGLTITEAFGVIFAGVVLVITFGSLLAAGMPLLTALIGVGASMGAIMVASALTTVSSTAPMLAVMIGLAVGIDYALFILSRHRNQLAAGIDPEESTAEAVATAGGAVVFAGITVIIALLGLVIVGIPFLSVMGIASAFAVFIAVAIAVTLLPAILGLLGKRMVPKAGSRAEKRAIASNSHDEKASNSLGARWVRLVMKAPIVFIVAVVSLLGVASIPAFSIDLNLPTSGQQSEKTTNRQAYDLIADGFGPGYNGPLVVAADITQITDIMNDLEAIGDELRTVDNVVFVSEGLPDATLDTAIFRVIPASAPDDPATKLVVEELRELADTMKDKHNVTIAVTGQTAAAIDISNLLTGALVPFGTLVVGLSIVLLAMVFRSITVPIKAAVGFLLSVGASFGISVAVFQWGWLSELLHVETTGPLISFLPILLMAILFGLAMDYEVFLVSGMREEYTKTKDAKRAVAVGFQNGARVVTAAALIMFFVFFAFVPEGSGAIKMIALALAVGVAVDAFLVRMTLVPAVMTLLGKWAWALPAWLDRILPNVDVEGEGLREHLESSEWAAAQGGDAITADAVAIGQDSTLRSFRVQPGTVAIVAGELTDRRLLGATIAGRIPPASGQLQVLGHGLPSEASALSRRVSLVDLATLRTDDETTLGEAFSERITLTLPWYRSGANRNEIEAGISRLALAVAKTGEPAALEAGTPISALSALAQSLLPVALASVDDAELLVIDAGDFGYPVPLGTFVQAIAALVAPTVTVLLGVNGSSHPHLVLDRSYAVIDLRPATDLSNRSLVEGAAR